MTPPRGRLLLVPTPLDFGCDVEVAIAQVLPLGTLEEAARLRHWVCENAKSMRAFLRRVGDVVPLGVPIREITITELPREVHKHGDHGGTFDARPLLAAAKQGHDTGLASEAGMPAVADPGSSVVRAAHDLGLEVVALVGPASLLMALAASGLNGQGFAFAGYLPQSSPEREKRVVELESIAVRTGQSQLFIETPYRNLALWESLVKSLKTGTRLAVASGLTLPGARVHSRKAGDWRGEPPPVTNDTPAVFLVGR